MADRSVTGSKAKTARPSALRKIALYANAPRHFVRGRFAKRDTDLPAQGEGKVIQHDGEKLAAYRDPDGNLHAVSAVCTHLKCIVEWNAAEKSWDCPCHGSRFDYEGRVLRGPATKDLEQKQVAEVATP